MTYYANVNSHDELDCFGNCEMVQDRYGSEDVKNIEVSEEVYNNAIEYGTNYYTYSEGAIILNPNYEQEEVAKEAERVSHLKCTKRVLALILQQLGFDYFTQIKPMIESNSQAALEWELCIELERCNPLLDIFGQQLGISPAQIDAIFKYANGEITTLGVQ